MDTTYTCFKQHKNLHRLVYKWRGILCILIMVSWLCLIPLFSFSMDITNVTSGELEIHQANNKAVFRDNVVLQHPYFMLYAQQLEVLYDFTAGYSNIKSAHGSGGVRIITEAESATSQFVTYDHTTKQIILHNDVKITRAGNTITADMYVYDIKTQKSTVKSANDSASDSKERAKIIINNLDGIKNHDQSSKQSQ